MKTIFRKVSPEKRTPTQTGRYHTNRGLVNYFHEELKYPPKGFEYSIDYWLEEIELPNDDHLEKRFPTNINEASDIKGTNSDNLCKQLGAEWMRDFVLGT